jgi:(5-formylfuran-3-yl)methyl phosphate synthase
MTQLLISVKNVAEALLVLEAGVDIIDLKDPNVGALGALDMPLTKQIVRAIRNQKSSAEYEQNLARPNFPKISAAVGEQHIDLNSLIVDIEARHALGLDMIKIVVSKLFYDAHFVSKMQSLTGKGIQLVAVFFADEAVDLALLPMMNQVGFYGAMLDTKIKRLGLLQTQTADDLLNFTQICHQYDLQSGFAGSLQPQHIASLASYNPTYIGFRGGACENLARKTDLCAAKVVEIKKLLLTHNKINIKPQKSKHLALHS